MAAQRRSLRPPKQQTIDRSFGRTIRKERRDRCLTLKQLGEMASVDPGYLCHLENSDARYPPRAEVVESLSRVLYLDTRRMTYMAGRIPDEDAVLLKRLAKKYGDDLPALLDKLHGNPAIAKSLLES